MTIVVQCIGIALLMRIIVVQCNTKNKQCIGIKLLKISIVVLCNRIKLAIALNNFDYHKQCNPNALHNYAFISKAILKHAQLCLSLANAIE